MAAVGKPHDHRRAHEILQPNTFVAGAAVPWSAIVAGRLAGNPIAASAGRMIFDWRALRSSGADQSSTGLCTWFPWRRRGHSTAVGVL